MSDDYEEFWAALPEKVMHPYRVAVVEALRWICEPLSAIALVDVLDGSITMWDAAYHLRVLEELGVVERFPTDPGGGPKRDDRFDLPYRLEEEDSDDDN